MEMPIASFSPRLKPEDEFEDEEEDEDEESFEVFGVSAAVELVLVDFGDEAGRNG